MSAVAAGDGCADGAVIWPTLSDTPYRVFGRRVICRIGRPIAGHRWAARGTVASVAVAACEGGTWIWTVAVCCSIPSAPRAAIRIWAVPGRVNCTYCRDPGTPLIPM